MNEDKKKTDLLIVGAGPTGMTAACEAVRHGLSVRIIERSPTRSKHSKALVLHARTMEAMELLGCAKELESKGQIFRGLHIHSRPKKKPLFVDLLDRNWGDTRYPFWLSIPQYETERILEQRLSTLGVEIEREVSLVSLEDQGEEVEALLSTPTGERRHTASWVLGCDGGRSTTRESMGIPLHRKKLGVTFALADVYTQSSLPEDEGHAIRAKDGLTLIVPMTEKGVWRLIAQLPQSQTLENAEEWEQLIAKRSGISLGIQRLGWNTQFELNSGIAERLRKGRVFFLGDAAHIHSPVGGQGLNTGVQDAHNLVWKLALLEKMESSDPRRELLLNSYEQERHPIAQKMVQNTEKATRLLTSRNPFLRTALNWLAPLGLRFTKVADKLGREVGMLELSTGGYPRLANPRLNENERLYDRLHPLRPTHLHWQGKEWLVRPDRVLAALDSLPHAHTVHIELDR